MSLTTKLLSPILGLSLLAGTACKKSEFKGGTATRTTKKTQDAVGDTPSKPTPNATVDEQVVAVDPVDPVVPVVDGELPSEEIEIPRVVSKKPQQVSASFKASETLSETFSFSLDTKSASSSFKLTDNKATKNERHHQNVRTAVTDSYQQGTAGMAMTENFEQKGQKGLVDILVVVDDSGSMDVEQKELGKRLESLLTSIQGTNWQIGVITSTVQANDRCDLSVIRSTDANASEKFRIAVTPGIHGSGYELGIKQAVTGLRCANAPWLRAEATTAVLIVSDEDNCSNDGADCGANPWAKESHLIDFIEKDLKKEFWKNAGVYGIFSPTTNPCPTALNVGKQYQRLMAYKNANGAHKNVGNICDSNYSSTLNQISADIALLLKSQFEISAVPDAGTLKLSVDGNTIPASHYTFVGRTITFAEGMQPANGKTLKVEYRVGATTRFKEVTLKNDPVPSSLAVKVGTTVLASSAYSLSGRKLSFVDQPADLAKITVDYRINGPMINTFQLEKTPLADTLKVTVNSQAAVGMRYDPGANQIIFNTEPVDGAQVDIAYDYRLGPNLVYNVTSVSGATNHKIYDGLNVIPFTKNGDSYTIRAENHMPGKTLILSYDAPDNAARLYDLAHVPVADSLVFSRDVPGCKLGSGITLSGNRLTANCAVTSKSEFELQYNYLEKFDTFALLVPEPERGMWEIRIDGLPFYNAVRTGNSFKIDFDKYLNLDSVIEIRYTFPE